MWLLNFLVRSGWVLCLALLVPVALPAGGSEIEKIIIRKREKSDPILLINSSKLLISPFLNSPSLGNLRPGTPLHVIRYWGNDIANHWLQVRINSGDIVGSKLVERRGWIHI